MVPEDRKGQGIIPKMPVKANITLSNIRRYCRWGLVQETSESAQARVEPVYETLEGWKATTRGARSWNDLPAQAVKYVRHIEELIGAPVALLSTSPERDDTILVTDPFQD